MKILIVNMFPHISAIFKYGFYLKKYLSKKNKVEFLDLWKDKQYHSDVKRAIALMKGIKLPDCDVLILVAPLLCNSLPVSNAKLKITIFHDMYALNCGSIPIQALAYTTYKNLKHSDLILPVSNFSKQEIINTYGLKDKLHMIHGGIDHTIFKPLNIKREKNTFLHVGRDDERKNFRFVLELIKNTNGKLIKVGSVSKDDMKYIEDNNLNVKIQSNVSDKELCKLYNKVSMLLFPSKNEGLGFPIIESHKCKCPVISANNSGLYESSIKENLTDLNQDLWIKKINEIQNNKKYRNNIIKKGLSHSKKFDWKLYTKHVDKLIVRCVKGNVFKSR